MKEDFTIEGCLGEAKVNVVNPSNNNITKNKLVIPIIMLFLVFFSISSLLFLFFW